MYVERSMTRKVVTIDSESSIFDARELMNSNRIRHLPVIDEKNHVIGIVSDRDIRSAMPSVVLKDKDCSADSRELKNIRVKDFMTRNPVCIPPTYTIQDVLLLIQEKRVGAFPVADEENKLLGILSIRDLVRAFINVLNIGEPGSLLCIVAEDRLGQMKRIVDAITEENVSFGSILVSRYWEEGKKAVFPYLLTNRTGPIKRKLESMGYEVLDPLKWYLDQLPAHE